MTNTIHPSWQPLFSQFDFDINTIYEKEKQTIYPIKQHVFRVFEMDVTEIKIVLLGQDPYHGPNQAHGLSFSVPDGIIIPPSLKNIFKEIQSEFPERNYCFTSGNLEKWFYREKIFLLNSSLTVIEKKAGSMMHIWKKFINKTIEFISKNNPNCIFLLLGNFAKSKSQFIENKNRIILGVHPSPLSAYNGFFGSGIFKNIELMLNQTINWAN